jgi:predicted kinase
MSSPAQTTESRDVSRPMILAITGPPCSGKSTLAKQIKQRHRFHFLQMDSIRRSLIPESHTKNDRNIAYRAMHLLAEYLILSNQSVILDATYLRFEHRDAVENIARALRCAVYLVECRIPPAIAVERFRTRSDHPAIDLTAELVSENAVHFPYSGRGLVLDTCAAVGDCVERIEHYLHDGAPLALDGSWSNAVLSR